MSPKEIYELPESWVWANLKEVGQIVTGNTPSKKDPTNYGDFLPWVKPPDLENDEPITSTKEMLSVKGAEKARVLPKGAVLVSCIGLLGKVGIAGRKLATNQQINAIVLDESVIPEYCYYYCKTHFMRNLLYANSSSTTIPIINKSRFSEIPFPLAPLNEQKRIVARITYLLKDIGEARQAVLRVQSIIRQLRESSLNETFNVQAIERKQLSELAQVFNGKAVGSGTSNIRVFKTRHVYPTGLRMDDPSYLKPEQEKRITSERFLRDGDVLIVNTWQNLGRVCYVDKPEENWTVDTQIMIVRAKEGNIGKYLFYFLLSRKGYELLVSCEKGALTAGPSRKLTHIYPKDVGRIPIPYLPPNMQSRAVSRIDSILESASTIETCGNTIETNIGLLEQAILAKAFRGELVPQDSNDEPAYILLERIKAIMPKTEKRRKIRRLPKGQKVLENQFSTIQAYLEENNGQATIEQVLEASGLTLDDFWGKLKSEMDHGQVRKVQKGKLVFLTVRV